MTSSLFSKPPLGEIKQDQISFFSTFANCLIKKFFPIVNKFSRVSKIRLISVSYEEGSSKEELRNISYIFVELAGVSTIAVLATYTLNGISSAYNERLVYKNFVVNDNNGLRLYLNTKREICPISSFYNALFLLNILIYTAWQAPEHLQLLSQYFTVSIENDSTSHMSLLLSSFSHKDPGHLLTSMSSIYGMLEIWKHHNHAHCTILDSCHGGEFLSFFVSSAVLTNMFSLAMKHALEIKDPTFGSSGVICSLMAYQLSVMPKITFPFELPVLGSLDNISLLNIITLCSILGFGGMVSNKVFDLGWNVSTDYSTQVAGYTFGMWYSNGGDIILKRWSKYAAKKSIKLFERIGF